MPLPESGHAHPVMALEDGMLKYTSTVDQVADFIKQEEWEERLG